MEDQSTLSGVFLGHVDADRTAANIDVEVDARVVRWSISPVGARQESASIESSDPKVRSFQREVNRMVRRTANRNRPVVTDFKQRAARRRQPVPVPCPNCRGVEPKIWDCETCDSAGVVPG